ncbi:MAG: hypothetical protein RLZZ165_1641 [Bacteroidota bacterium]|jgi:hypothetical protein
MTTARQGAKTWQPWIHSARVDLAFIIAPAFLVTLVVLLFPRWFQDNAEMAPWAWLLLIVGVDVAHVYSTLWRTYLDPTEFARHRVLLTYTPIAVWVGGMLLYAIGAMLFWRVLAYLAVFHFVRQQYGFMAVYARRDARSKAERYWDAFTIYTITLYPILFWHTHLPRNFSWFVEGDFIDLGAVGLQGVGRWIHAGAVLAYLVKELKMSARRGFNVPKNLIVLGTGLSWYCGIILCNGDLAFTATNVVSHGLPYIAMVWMYGRKKHVSAPLRPAPNPWMKFGFRLAFLPVFLGLLLALAYLEEGLWDGLVWRDHEGLFPWADALPFLRDAATLSVVVPLLSLPQVTHYIVDGFIWKLRRKDGDLRLLE